MCYIDAIAGPSLFLGGTNLLLIAAVIIFFAVSVVLVVRVKQYIEVKRKKAKEQSNDAESQNNTL